VWLLTIPERLYDKISDLMLNSWITSAQREGVGEKREQLMIKMSISLGFKFVLLKTSLTTSKMTVLLSSLACSEEVSLGRPSNALVILGGHAVFGPTPLVSNNLFINSKESSV
jgi:hypothetical protein